MAGMLGEGALEDSDRGLGRAARERPARGAAQQHERIGIGVRRRHQQVRRDLLLGCILLAEDRCRSAVCLTPGQRRTSIL